MNKIGDRIRAERKRLGLNQTEMAQLGRIELGAQGNYERNKRSPTADYLAEIAGHGADVAFIITGKRSGDALPADEQQWLNLYRSGSEEQRAMFLRMMEAAIGTPAETAKASDLLPEKILLQQMFEALLKGVDRSETDEQIAEYLADSLEDSLKIAELPWEIHPDTNGEHGEQPQRKRA